MFDGNHSCVNIHDRRSAPDLTISTRWHVAVLPMRGLAMAAFIVDGIYPGDILINMRINLTFTGGLEFPATYAQLGMGGQLRW